jgi:hypothetical protein
VKSIDILREHAELVMANTDAKVPLSASELLSHAGADLKKLVHPSLDAELNEKVVRDLLDSLVTIQARTRNWDRPALPLATAWIGELSDFLGRFCGFFRGKNANAKWMFLNGLSLRIACDTLRLCG